jgi:hypothetical protein
MKSSMLAVCALALCAATATAQAPCSTVRAVADSAREDALLILTSDRPLIRELRQEQHMVKAEDLAPVTVVSQRYICARLAGAFNRLIAPGVQFAVLRIGPLYYARDPDQKRGTGVFTDTTFKVLMRLGAAIP